MMATVAFILALVSFTASIYLATGCGSIPTSRQELVSFYLSTRDCGYPYLERIFSQKSLLVDCKGDSATISTEMAEYRIRLVALCILPDGTCFEENRVDLLYGQSSVVITLPANSSDCLFGACSFGEDDDQLVYVNLSKCAATTSTEVTEYLTVPTNASTAPQTTIVAVDRVGSTNSTPQAPTGAVDPTGPTSSSDPQATSTSDKHSAQAIISAMLITISATVLLIVVLVVVAISKRIRPTLKQVFSSDANFKVTFQPMTLDAMKVLESHETIHLKLYDTDLYAPDGLEGVLLTANKYYQTTFNSTNPAKVQNEPLAQEGVGNKVTLSSVVNYDCQLGTNPSELKQSLCRDSSGLVINGFDKVIDITNERNTDNLPPATLTGLKANCEMLDKGSYGRNMFRGPGGNQDILNSSRSSCDNDPTEHVQEDELSFSDDNVKNSVVGSE